MFCVNCGNQMPDGSQFCPSCGTPVQAPRMQASQTVVQQPVQPQPVMRQPVQPQPVMQQPMMQGYQQPMGVYRRPEEYLNLKSLKTWAAVLILLSPLFGIWSYVVVGKIPNATSENEARSLYRKAKNLCIIGSIFAFIGIVIYSGM